MCNTYNVKPQKGASGLKARISEDLAKLKSLLIRKSDSGVVVLGEKSSDTELTSHIMRWGFHRAFNSSINNSRSDKLDSHVWKQAYESRRCLIPVSSYYEWGEGIGGKKQAYLISKTSCGADEDDWLWIAGLWEENPELGRCYSMITTAAAPSVGFIHDRMPAVLPWETALEFLSGGSIPFSPYAGQIVAVLPLAVYPRCAEPKLRIDVICERSRNLVRLVLVA